MLRHQPGDGALGQVDAEREELPMDSRGAPDFLWFMSSDFFLRLPQQLPRHRGEVVLIVIRSLAFPHHEDDLQPLCAQRPEGLAMRMSPHSLLIVVRPGPLIPLQREERHLIDDVAQRLVTGEAELDEALLAAPLRHGHGSRLCLQMPKRLPTLGASPRRAQSVGAVMPWSPMGSVRIHCAVGMRAKKSSIASRYSLTAATTAASSATRVRINRALARTTWAGTGSCGRWRTFQSSRVRASLSR